MSIAVVKYGGAAMADPTLRATVAVDVLALHRTGVHVVVVHGAGPQITAELARRGRPAVFSGGQRVTTAETLEVVRSVLVDRVNRELVDQINTSGQVAVGVSGADAGLLIAERRGPDAPGQVDPGLVGDVTDVRPEPIHTLLDGGRIPVVAGLARTAAGALLNVNADAAAAALAVALGAERLMLLTDVAGLCAGWDGQSGRVLARLTAAELSVLVGTLDGGMRPKMQACLRAVRGGVAAAQVLDGRVPHALLGMLAGPGPGPGAGTTVTA